MPPPSYLESAANAMLAAADAGRPLEPVLKDRCPQIRRQILADRDHPAMLALWGRSCNFDEHARQTIVAPPILRLVGELANVPMRGRFVHAGLAHTYGYLFSLIETPYGPKRTRWVTTAIEDAFGLDPTLLSDAPAEGTLLANLTRFLGGIVSRGGAGRPATWPAAREIERYDFGKLRGSRIVETVEAPGGDLRIVTDLVPYPNPPAGADAEDTLLAYSVRTGSRPQRLITAFPMRPAAAQELVASARSRRKVPIQLKYNAYVRGRYGRAMTGYRTLEAAGG